MQGLNDRKLVTAYLADKNIAHVLSSPYRRAVDTVRDYADKYDLPIEEVYAFRERKVGSSWISDGDFADFVKHQWVDFTFKNSDGESLLEVQERNIAALTEILTQYAGQSIAIGTHGTALSTIINYYDPVYGLSDFQAMVNLMPWIVKMQFNGLTCTKIEKIDVFKH